VTPKGATNSSSWSNDSDNGTSTAVIYLRVSSRDQATRDGEREGLSIPAQREACYAKAASLDAAVVEEFVDAGKSAKTAQRPELQRMLVYLREHRIRHVLVHKVDRLARDRRDDIEITLAIRATGATLVSCTENIDETPSGLLVHGIMSSIAEYNNRNLATEVLKGLVQNAKNGGTPGKASLGYLNVRKVENHCEVRTVEVDPVRGPLIAWAFEAYATGEHSTLSLLNELNQRGLTTPATATKPEGRLSWSHIPDLLSNPYYKGVVRYMGVDHDGKHTRLVSPATWQRVQEVLASHRSGEKQRTHRHYLKSSLFCGQCGSRLIVTNAKSSSGRIYPYYICIGRHQKRNDCKFKAVPIETVEALVEEHYATIQIRPEWREVIEEQLHSDLIEHYREAKAEQQRLTKQRARLLTESAKLLEARYADAIPFELFESEQTRIKAGLETIDNHIAITDDYQALVAANLRRALDLASDCQTAYATAPTAVRRLLNQAFFKRLYVDDENHVRSELAAPFDVLLVNVDTTVRPAKTLATSQSWWQAIAASWNDDTREEPVLTGVGQRPSEKAASLKEQVMVERIGIEPMTSALQRRRSPS
jgi:site-specific DNA recombinase